MAIWITLSVGCSSEKDFKPKPKGYHYIHLPPHQYVPTPDSLPYSFEYSAHAKLLNDTSFMAERFWTEIYYPTFTATINVSFKIIRSPKDLRDYVNDCYKLAQKHNIRAESIEEVITKTPSGMTAVMYQLEGDVPTTFQFYVTDSVRYFFRTSLYFPTSQKNDSLAPLIRYTTEDMIHILNTLRWNHKVADKLR
ncbi:MAG: gliding motility lipoprotein GldD [Cytophagales bacterium]|nr:gliding motility lipoprotein GldD [Bernardetiaceae bacterium]MDW8209891.1 gliding motility lipoprotein GldD [Cytophagales bacterium]